MLYLEVYNYYGEDKIPLDIHSGIKYNNLLEGVCGHSYVLDSDCNKDKTMDYEPFIIDEDTCGFTIIDDDFSIDIVNDLVQYVLKILNYDSKYIVNLRYVDYGAKSISDESNRNGAFITMLGMLGYEEIRKNNFVRKLVNKKVM